MPPVGTEPATFGLVAQTLTQLTKRPGGPDMRALAGPWSVRPGGPPGSQGVAGVHPGVPGVRPGVHPRVPGVRPGGPRGPPRGPRHPSRGPRGPPRGPPGKMKNENGNENRNGTWNIFRKMK